jgi:hypothetical protein
LCKRSEKFIADTSFKTLLSLLHFYIQQLTDGDD